MITILGSSVTDRKGLRPFLCALRFWAVSVLFFSLLIFPIISSAGKPAGSPGGGSGGKPGPGTVQILPMRLGLPSGCSSAYGIRMNNGAEAPGNPVVAIQANCGTRTLPYTWQGGAWQSLGTLPPAMNGDARDVSDLSVTGTTSDPTIVGFMAADPAGNGSGIFVKSPGSGMQLLDLLAENVDWAASTVRISEQGGHIVGGNNSDDWTVELAGRWSFDGTGWVGEVLGPGFAFAVSDDGTVVVGNTSDYNAWMWVEGSGLFSLGPDTYVLDIDAAASMIVGFRWRECPSSSSCTTFPQPVYWNLQGDNPLVAIDLIALDGVDSWARAVAEVNGKHVIVGHGFTRKDAIERAVAWIPDADGNYGTPTRLDAIDGKTRAWAFARDINRHGQVLGHSQAGNHSESVIWTLP